MEEVWKPIIGYEERYEVSNWGNVKSLRYGNTHKAKLLVPKCNNMGRLWVELRKDGKSKCMLIHRLVAMAFISNPNDCPQINHIDENPKNNHVDNLEWCTGSYNVRAYLNNHPDVWKNRPRRRIGRYKKNYGLEIDQCDKEGNVIKHWRCVRDIEVENKWSAWSIVECCRGNRKTAYGYKWNYTIDNISGREVAQ